MSKYTKAYSKLLLKLSEANVLTKEAKIKELKNALLFTKEINAFSRGALVLLSGYLEAYIKDLGELVIDSIVIKSVSRQTINDSFFYHISKDMLSQLKDITDPEASANKIFSFIDRDINYWSKNGAFPLQIPSDRFNKGFSNPSYDKISKYLKRFGYKNFDSDLKAVLKGNYQFLINTINNLVDVRNKISHGDSNISKTPTEIDQIISTVKDFCREIDILFANWCKNNYCTIR